MRIVGVGSRTFDQPKIVSAVMDGLLRYWSELDHPQRMADQDFLVASGQAKGADMLVEKWATYMIVPFTPYPADWNVHGNAAGPIRNTQKAC